MPPGADLHRLAALLDQALDGTPAERAALLARVRGEDAALGDALARALAAATDAGERTLQPGGALQGELGRACLGSTLPAETLPAGSVLGAYRIESLIGRGGAADVYSAFRSFDGFTQRVALKLVRPGARGAPTRAVEQRALARLSHPAIARFLDAGTIDGQAFLAMELVDGVPITEHAAQHRVPLRERVGWVVELCEALAHAHSQLIIHCDIKPTNVLVDRRRCARLLDFGIANLLDATTDAQPAFSPAFAAPEQVRGEALSTATDVFQLGALLHVLLTGTPWPQDPQRIARGDYFEILGDAREAPSARLAARGAEGDAHARSCGYANARALAARLRPDLDAIVLRCLAARPEQRYASVGKLADDLLAWCASRPVAAVPASRLRRLRLWSRRNRRALAGSVAALALVSAVAAGFAWRVAGERAAREREQARAAAAERFLSTVFQQASPYAVQNTRAPLQSFVRVGDALLAADRSLDPRTRARMGVALARLELQQGEAAAALRRMRALWSQPASGDAALDAQLALALGNAMAQSDDIAGAITLWLQPRVAAALAGAEPDVRLALLAGRGDLHRQRGDLDAARVDFERARPALLATTMLTPERVAALQMYVNYLDQAGRLQDLAPVALALARPLAQVSPPGEAQRLVALSYVEVLQGDPVRAGEHAARAAGTFARTLGATHPQVAKAHLNACMAYRDAGMIGAARAQCSRAYDALRTADRLDSDDASVASINLAGIELVAGRWRAAREWLAAAAPALDPARSPYQAFVAATLRARLAFAQGHVDESLAAFDAADALRQRHFAAHAEVAAHVAEHRIPVLLAAGRIAHARALFDATAPDAMPPGLFRDRALAGRQLTAARIAAAAGEHARARRLVDAALAAQSRLDVRAPTERVWLRLDAARIVAAADRAHAVRLLREAGDIATHAGDLPVLAAHALLMRHAIDPAGVTPAQLERARREAGDA